MDYKDLQKEKAMVNLVQKLSNTLEKVNKKRAMAIV